MARSARTSFIGSTCFRSRCPRCGNARKTLRYWWSTSSIATRGKPGKTIRRGSKRTLDLLRAYPWPGNVRELQNVIERSVIVSDPDEFTVDESWLSTARRSRAGSACLARWPCTRRRSSKTRCLKHCGRRVWAPQGAGATRDSTFNAGIEDSYAEDQQESLSHTSAKAFLK